MATVDMVIVKMQNCRIHRKRYHIPGILVFSRGRPEYIKQRDHVVYVISVHAHHRKPKPEA